MYGTNKWNEQGVSRVGNESYRGLYWVSMC